MVKKMIGSGLIYFFVIIVLGLILRLKMIIPIIPELQFMHLVHAHSHVAFLGWVYFMLIAILVKYCLPEHVHNSPSMKFIFYGTHLSVLGMLISFTLQGYALFSILFSTIHIFLSYFFAFVYFKHRKNHLPLIVQLFFNTGVILMLLSSVGPWALAVVGAKGLSNTPIFNVFIFLYLHLQYNGWFTFILMGTTYLLLDLPYSIKQAKWQYAILLSSVFPSFIPAIMWYGLPSVLEGIGIVGAILQLVATTLFLKIVWKLYGKEKSAQWLLQISFLCLGIKSLMETFESLPILAEMIPSNRQVIIGYLHLTLLGFVSSFLLYYLFQENNPKVTFIGKKSVHLYSFGTLSMIALLFLAGLLEWLHFPLHLWIWISLFLASLIAGVGILFMLPNLTTKAR
ncbi:MAG TPA: hypothetical protein VJ824_12160 [Bacillota bacterium]|nr:hypothetical protein [Bacillota bacterium]